MTLNAEWDEGPLGGGKGRMARWKILKSTFHETEGQGLVEYALIITFVAVSLVAGLQALAGGISPAFTNIVASL
jgi:Flp pilus assembly pilin Flp